MEPCDEAHLIDASRISFNDLLCVRFCIFDLCSAGQQRIGGRSIGSGLGDGMALCFAGIFGKDH